MRYLPDRWHHSKLIQKLLAQDRRDEALLLVQRSSKDFQIIVSWNFLIEYDLKNQRLHSAVKLFNDVSPARTQGTGRRTRPAADMACCR